MTAFDISEQRIEKARRLAEYNKVDVRFFKGDIFDYQPDTEYDIIFSSGEKNWNFLVERRKISYTVKGDKNTGTGRTGT